MKKAWIKNFGVDNPFKAKVLKEKIAETNIERYGFSSPAQSKEIHDKMLKTMIKNHGVPYSMQSHSLKQKREKTCIKKYGVSNPTQWKEIQEKAKKNCLKKHGVEFNFQRKDVKEKIKSSMLKNHGVEHALQNNKLLQKQIETCKEKYGVNNGYKIKGVKEKSQRTMMKRYGSMSAMGDKKTQEKYKKTCLKNHGVDNPFKSKKVREKSKKTCLIRHGVEFACQNPEILAKAQRNSHKVKPYLLNGRTVYVQGYEPQAIDYVISRGVKPSRITVSSEKGAITSRYAFRGKDKKYIPDFYIKTKNRKLMVVEVKCLYTLLKTKRTYKQVVAKSLSFINDSRYNFRLILIDKKGIVTKLPKDWYTYTYKQIQNYLKSPKSSPTLKSDALT